MTALKMPVVLGTILTVLGAWFLSAEGEIASLWDGMLGWPLVVGGILSLR